MAAVADPAAGRARRQPPGGAPAARRRAGGNLQHAAAPDRARRAARRTPGRPRGSGQRPGAVGGVQGRWRADARSRRLRAKARRRGVGARAGRDPQGHVPGVSAAGARPRRGGRAARPPAGRAPGHGVSQADALGRLAGRRQGRVAVWPAHSLDPLPVRRPRGAVHHPAQRRRAVRARAGGPVGGRDLRAPLPGHLRPRGPEHQGPDLRRVPRQARRELRDPRPQRTARQRSPASSTRTPSAWAGG